MKREAGFTIVEILCVVVLLGFLLSIMYNVIVQNAFHQKRVKNEMEAQNSAKALLNHIGEVVMEQNTPIITAINSNSEYTKDSVYNNITSMNFNGGAQLRKAGDVVTFDSKTYNYISSINVKVNDRGMTVTIIAGSDKSKAEFSSTFYTRNT